MAGAQQASLGGHSSPFATAACVLLLLLLLLALATAALPHQSCGCQGLGGATTPAGRLPPKWTERIARDINASPCQLPFRVSTVSLHSCWVSRDASVACVALLTWLHTLAGWLLCGQFFCDGSGESRDLPVHSLAGVACNGKVYLKALKPAS